MKTVEHFICEICKEEYKEKDKCMECEDNHRKPIGIVSSKYSPIRLDKTGLPITITIEVEGGKEQ